MKLKDKILLISSTHPTLTSVFKLLLPEINEIITFTDKPSEKYFAIINDIFEKPMCIYCDKPKTYYNIKLGYANTCGSKSCAAKYSFEIHPELKEIISLRTTGRKHSTTSKALMSDKAKIFNNDPIKKQKMINTCIKKHGVINPFQLEEVKQKSRETNITKYGVEYHTQREVFREYLRSDERRLSYEITRAWTPLIQKEDFKHYRLLVERETKQHDISNMSNFDKRGRGIDSYHLDHKYSIKQGFIDGIIPSIIGGINNLEFITCSENTSKWSRCSITIEELYQTIK